MNIVKLKIHKSKKLVSFDFIFFVNNQNSQFQLRDFFNHIQSGGEYDVVGGLRQRKYPDALPNSYLLKGDIVLNRPLDLAGNIEKNFISELHKHVDPNVWTLVITQEGIYNRVSRIKAFCLIAGENLPDILFKFKEKSKTWPKAFIFVNIIYTKSIIGSYAKQKIQEQVLYYENLTKKSIKAFPSQSAVFSYMCSPHDKITVNEEAIFFSNKTFVFGNGKIVAKYKKKILGLEDFKFYDQSKGIRFFNNGLNEKDEIKYKEFFKIFNLAICADIEYGLWTKQIVENNTELPRFFILQSDTISLGTIKLQKAFVIHIDSIAGECTLKIHYKNLSFEISPTENNKEGFYQFLKWKGIHESLFFEGQK